MLSTLLLAGLLAGLVTATGTQPPARISPVTGAPRPMATSINTTSVTPATITFTAPNPISSPIVNGSASALVSWKTAGGSAARAWTLGVSAPAAFGSCSTVPASAVKVTCGTVTGGFAGACSAASNLSTTSTKVAGGNEGTGSTSYSVSLSFTLSDSWSYIASSSCSLSVTYTITAN